MNNFDDIDENNNIMDIAITIANKLGIDHKRFVHIIEQQIPGYESVILDKDLVKKIKMLLNTDDKINDFEKKISGSTTKNNFHILKEHLAELQISVLIKKLKKAGSADEVLGSFLVLLNNKFEAVNGIMEQTVQSGGGDKNSHYYEKYMKYKLKNDLILINFTTL